LKHLVTIAGAGPATPHFARRLAAAGHSVCNLGDGDKEPATLDLLLLMPRDVMQCEEMLFEQARFARRAKGPASIILSASLSPRYVAALRARIPATIALIDALPDGTPRDIESGRCTVLLGGTPASITTVSDVLACFGQTQTHMGAFGTATAAKTLRDCLAAATSAMTRSALDWASAQGIEEGRLVRLLDSGIGAGQPRTAGDCAAMVPNTLPGDNAGATLVRDVESALELALRGVHLTPPQNLAKGFASVRSRHLH